MLHLGFLGGSAGKVSTCNAGDLGLIPGLGRSPGEGNGYLLQYSGLENSWTVARQAPRSMGILQAKTLEWVAISFPRVSS